MMPLRLLAIVSSPQDVLKLSTEELARALLQDMQAREQDPTSGMAQRDSLGVALVTPGVFPSVVGNAQELQRQLNRAGANTYDLLERSGLIEPHHDRINKMNGYLVLTARGRTTTKPVDYEGARLRSLLQREMASDAAEQGVQRLRGGRTRCGGQRSVPHR